MLRGLLFLSVFMLAAPTAVHAQVQQLRSSEAKLDSIRQEQNRLQEELQALRSRVRDASDELTNIARQREASASALLELDYQTSLLDESADSLSQQLASTQSQVRHRTNQLGRRLRSIYKRGPMHSVRVLLTAESFADLINRYRYLHILARRDRSMIEEVRQLERSLVAQNRALQETMQQIESLRAEKEAEVAELERLEQQSQSALAQYRNAQTRTESRLERLAQDEREMASLITRLERERVERERADANRGRTGGTGVPAAEPSASISTRDLGTLAWPVDGNIIYRFGPERRPNGVVLRNQGIGIATAAGTPVRAVETGTVVLARPFEGYGPTVMLSHGGGYYTLYLYLGRIDVTEGQTIPAGATVGTVGGERTPEGPHVEFQVRAPVRTGVPEAVDPLRWLRERAGS
ncbi:MAG: murein hydrolase activator EnvC family protein [Longimicrobiales bacterium]